MTFDELIATEGAEKYFSGFLCLLQRSPADSGNILQLKTQIADQSFW